MSILRVRKKENPYTQIYNRVFQDKRLSYTALGILTYLISKPANWEVHLKCLERPGLTGREAVRSAVKELMEVGYVQRRPVQDSSTGQMKGWDYDVFEEPPDNHTEKIPTKGVPPDGTPHDGFPSGGEPSPINKESSNKDQSNKKRQKESPTLAEQGSQIPSFSGVKRTEVVRGAPASGWPSLTRTAPPFVVPASEWPTVTPEAPPVAADAAPEEDAHDEPGTSSGGVLSKLDPKFPRLGRAYDYCAWVRENPEEAAAAAKLSAVYPREAPISEDREKAEKYYNRRYTGMLRLQDVDMIARYWGKFWVAPDPEPPTNLDGLLRKDKLPIVLGGCRDWVRVEIQNLRMDGEEDDGPNWTIKLLLDAKDKFTPETDLVGEMLMHGGSAVAVMFAGYERGSQNLEQCKVRFRQEIIDCISRWPHWLAVRQDPAAYPAALGITMAEAEEFQRRFFAEKEAAINALKTYL